MQNSPQDVECNKYTELKKKSEKNNLCRKSICLPLVNTAEASLLNTWLVTKRVLKARIQPKCQFR